MLSQQEFSNIPNSIKPKVSVCLTIHNAAEYIKECIDSILCQTFTDLEILIVDNESKDEGLNIIRSYSDSRIRLICNDKGYIQSKNILLNEARGEYLALMDINKVMLPKRLSIQVDFMEKNQEVGVYGGKTYSSEENEESSLVQNKSITIYDMLGSCCLEYSSVMLRTKTLRKYHFQYEENFFYAADYRLWMQMLKRGVSIVNSEILFVKDFSSSGEKSNQVGYYSKEEKNDVVRIKQDVREWIYEQEKACKEERITFPTSGNEMTLVIPFMNEGEEVANTVRSARHFVGDDVDIIVVNDHSTDGYDYEKDLRGLNVRYVVNKFNIGAAASKEKGVQLTTTPYFILLDAHMRFYSNNWLPRYLEELKKNDRKILCCQTKWLSKENGILLENDNTQTWGAFLQFNTESVPPQIHWREYKKDSILGDNKIAAVLGATYGASKRYWNHIKGLQGLIHYGCEEAYLSLKVYMEGGTCNFLSDVIIGHIYRKKPPYTFRYAETVYNKFFLIYTLFPTQLKHQAVEKYRLTNPILLEEVELMQRLRMQDCVTLKNYYEQTFLRPFSYVLEINNMICIEDFPKVKDNITLLEKVNKFLSLNPIPMHDGIENGKMAWVLYFCVYAATMEKEKYDDKASELFFQIEKNLMNDAIVNFQHGICGIGWAIMFLNTNGYLNDVEDILQRIDRMVMERDLRRISDYSFNTGFGGILAYVSQRLICYKYKGHPQFDIRYMQDIWLKCDTLLKQKGETEDIRCRNFALQLLDAGIVKEEELLPLKLEDIYALPAIINQNESLWEASMQNCIGFGLRTLLDTKKLKRVKPIRNIINS